MADADRDPDRLFLLSSFGKETALVTPIFATTMNLHHKDKIKPDYALASVTKHLVAGQEFCVVS